MTKDLEIIRGLDEEWGRAKIKRAGGQTNRNYIVEIRGKKFFARLPWETGVIDRKIEGKNILALNRCRKLKRILPRYHLYILNKRNILKPNDRNIFSAPDGTMVTEFVEGKLFDLSMFKKEKYQRDLAKIFYAFHSSGVRFVNKYNSFRDELGKYRIEAERHHLPKFVGGKTVLFLKNLEKEADGKIPKLKRGVPAHNDFLFQNIIAGKDGGMYLLDFEYAGMNEKGGILYDLGYFFADNVFRHPPMTKTLYDKFLRIADKIYCRPLDREQIYWLALATPILQIWWGLVRYLDSKDKKDKDFLKDYILRRIEGIDRLYGIVFKQKGVKES